MVKAKIVSPEWSREKHVPLIRVENKTKLRKQDLFRVRVSVGRQEHPNTAQHHISWISLNFLPAGEKLPYEVARAEFNRAGEQYPEPNNRIFTVPQADFSFIPEQKGMLSAAAYCTVHGLWLSSGMVKVG